MRYYVAETTQREQGIGRAGHVECRVIAPIQQEDVGIAGSIAVHSHDLPRGVDPANRGIGRAGHVERGVAALVKQEGSK